jgi:hypothetical protein
MNSHDVLPSGSEKGSHVVIPAEDPQSFIAQYLAPLFFWRTRNTSADNPQTVTPSYLASLFFWRSSKALRIFTSEEQFWRAESNVLLGRVQLNGFKITDWFPRVPGIAWSDNARHIRDEIYRVEHKTDAKLGQYFLPESKRSLIEQGGIGTVRLRSRKIDGKDYWLATALSGIECYRGIPLAIPKEKFHLNWGDEVEIRGHVGFLQDAGLDEIAAQVHHARPLIVFVDRLKGIRVANHQEIVITPVVLFETDKANYTFVQCEAGSDSEEDAAADWIETYATKFNGRVVTNFDEQRPILAEAPLSYQRLLRKTYEREALTQYAPYIDQRKIFNVYGPAASVGDANTVENVTINSEGSFRR